MDEKELLSRASEIIKSLRISSDCVNCEYTFGADYCVVCGYDKGAADLIELLLNKCKTYQNEIAEKKLYNSSLKQSNGCMERQSRMLLLFV